MPSHSILITGSNSGFGRLMVEALARKGHTVFASMRGLEGKNAAAARELREQAAREGLALHVVELDVTNDATVDAAVRTVLEKAGRVDVLVNNAGLGAFGPLEAFSVDELRMVLEVDLLGAARVTRAVLPHMRQQRSGLLIHVSSVVGRVLVPGMGPLCIAKYALEAMAETYHYELAPFGIESVLVEPGVYPTEAQGKVSHPADLSRRAPYGDQTERAAMAWVQALLASAAPPQPRQVSEAVVGLIELQAGQRPLRTVVADEKDISGGLTKQVNEASQQAQAQLLKAMR